MSFLKKHSYFMVCLLITALSFSFMLTRFSGSFDAIVNSAVEFFQSLKTYFYFLFFSRLPPSSPITAPDASSSSGSNVLPVDPREFKHNLSSFFKTLFSGNNFVSYTQKALGAMIIILRVLPVLVLLAFVLRKYVKDQFLKHNNDYNEDSKPLRVFKIFSDRLFTPVKRYCGELISYIKQSRFLKTWILIWLFNFNIFAVLLSVLSIMLFFFISFDFVSLYYFFYNSIMLLVPMFRFVPLLLWVVAALYFIDRWRKKRALRRLNHMENKNKGFILERSICTMLVGTMGKGKTTLVTDMSLSIEAIFRYKAYELMLETDLKFPSFPYIVLENEFKKAIENGAVFNLASAAAWIDEREYYFKRAFYFCAGKTDKQLRRIMKRAAARGVPEEVLLAELVPEWGIFDYDYKKYGFYYDDKKTLTYLFDALKDYVKLYFIYVVSSSLILSNYAIRTDFKIIDRGNLPLWNLDFFDRDTVEVFKSSRRSHILDFDMLRLGKKLIEKNENANVFEFGTIAITEIGKERGNQFKNQELKETIKQLRETIKELEKAKADASSLRTELLALTNQATQLTDKFNDSLKLIRHKCTVCGFPFARVLLDEQRPESLGADARDLCEIVHIRDKSDTFLSMPFYFIGELLHSFIFLRFKGAYGDYRFNRGDNTLLMHLLKVIGSKVHQSYTRIYNRFGYHVRQLAVEDAATGTVIKECLYFVSTKKIYSNRFSTDAYGDIFARGLRSVGIGLDDLPEYESDKASEAELKIQNSYFINEITKYGGED